MSGQERQELARLLCEDAGTVYARDHTEEYALWLDAARAVMLEHVEEYAKLALPEPAYYRAMWCNAPFTAAVVKARGIADAKRWFEKEYEMPVSFEETTEEVYVTAIIAGVATHDAT